MILKSLTIQGFKSFAGRITLELPAGVAAVVGPNGSGKSNISDAIRWVLGEQSVRVLRGSRLEDVIFAGSDTKRAVGMAEVSLTFDNTSGKIPLEYAEVTVTRRVYRSGESAFFINKSPCRLRDIQELFMDTGLGKGSLAIIGQGEVDSILSARPEDRRAFLEETAKVAKYRAKKREAQSKLAQTEESLVRIGDLVAEIGSRLGPLEERARLAEEWRVLKERLDTVEVRLLVGERRETLAAFENHRHRMEQTQKELASEEARAAALKSKADELNDALESLDQRVEQARSAAEAAREQEVAATHRAELAKERLSRADVETAERIERLENDRASVEAIEAAHAEAEEKHMEADSAYREKESEHRRVTEKIDVINTELHSIETQLAEARHLSARALERSITEKGRLESARKDLTAASELDSSDTHRIQRLKTQVHGEEEALEEQIARLDFLSTQEDDTKRAIFDGEKEWEEIHKARRELEKRQRQERRRLDDIMARERALAQMQEAREGFHRGVRSVLQAASKQGWRLKGAVAELITPPKELEVAIETALGGAAQFVVAETEIDAKRAIEYLKAHRLGRATFLPLDSVRVPSLPKDSLHRLTQIDGSIGLASDLIDVSHDLMPVFRHLLGRVAIVRDLNAAMAVSKAVKGLSRVVTLDGDIVNPGGAWTGGSRPTRSDGLISRNRQLDELAERRAVQEALVARIDDEEKEWVRRADAVRQRIESGKEQLRQLEIQRLNAERDVKESERELARLRREIAEEETKEEKRAAHQVRLEEEIARLEKDVSLLEKERSEAEEAVLSWEKAVEECRISLEQYRAEAESLRVELAQLQAARDDAARERNRTAQEREKLAQRIAEEQARLASLEREKAKAKEEIEEAKVKAATASAEFKEASARLDRLREEERAIKAEADAVDEKLQDARERIAKTQKSEARLEIEGERIRDRLNQIEEGLNKRSASLHDLPDLDSEDEEDPIVLRAQARSLRQRIDALGPVNPDSVQEYQEVKERYDFLTEQKVDLQEAKQGLEEVIARIDRESGEKLKQTLDEVGKAFSHVFKRLFGGGEADIRLVDPDDPLESGVEIFVQPPGKRLQNMLALSGGEKSLAAIALLFALLAVQPSPFCLLDEIDAALDDHNLERFRDILHEYARETQFLVITHRQGTMESADSLFGVTMEESGVSSLVCLKLDNVKTA